MNGQYAFYIEANIVCVAIIFIMIFHDYLNKARQEKQIRFDYSLTAFGAYCISDALWAAVVDGYIPQNNFTIVLTNFLNFVILIAITYTWLKYVMAVEQISYRNTKKTKYIMISPFLLSTLALIIIYFVNPRILIDENNELQVTYHILMNVVTYIYIASVLFYTINKARKELNRVERRNQILIGVLPLGVVIGGLLQMIVSPSNPIFCFTCVTVLIIYYIRLMEDQISLDPLTRLNNRGQLSSYLSAENGGHKEGKMTFVIMMDINDFKIINDTYGHSEGDKALVLVANSLKRILNNSGLPGFLGRFGGDEFIIIIHPDFGYNIEEFISNIRNEINNDCQKANLGYMISMGIGYDELKQNIIFDDSLAIADKKLYENKKIVKEELAKMHNKSSA